MTKSPAEQVILPSYFSSSALFSLIVGLRKVNLLIALLRGLCVTMCAEQWATQAAVEHKNAQSLTVAGGGLI